MLSSASVLAQSSANDSDIQEVLVLGSDFRLSGDTQTATEGMVFSQQLEQRPISRTAELLEFVPGMIATQHSGEGKANQYFVRGFNLDHGTDFAISLDSMPVNMSTHAHGHGYADMNFIIPELVRSMRYRKGPYYGNKGDFATAGSADIAYADRLNQGRAHLTLGKYDYQRLFAGQSLDVGAGAITLAGALTRYNGPWDLDQDLDKRNLLMKYHEGDETYNLAISLMTYNNEWQASDQIPMRAVESGQLSEWGNIDPSDAGKSNRYSLSLNFDQQLNNNRSWEFNSYLMDYGLDLYSNFTYFAADPVRGDQFEQKDERKVAGFDSAYRHAFENIAIPTTFTAGVQHRYDDIHVGLHQTETRQRYATIRDDKVEQSLSSAYLSLESRWNDNIRTVAALRADHYRFDVNDQLGNNSGNGNDTLISPKLSLVYTPVSGIETFISAGQGFHSNDARGATVRFAPDGSAIDPVDPLAEARSVEAGFRTALIPKTQLSLTAFKMRMSSELIYVGDEGSTEALTGSDREGAELSVLYTPTNWLLVDADFTYTDAHMRDVGADDRIPNAVEKTASLGLTLENLGPWTAGLRLRYLGEAPLNEDNSVRTDGTFLTNGQVSYAFSDNLSASLEVLNLLDSDDHDISYFYASRLPGEVGEVEDIHYHPAEPRNVRLNLEYRF
jgi:outer membrane receptor protein involved in Fe transport